GRGIANPLAAILCASMLLDHLGQGAAAAAIEQAVRRVLAEGAARTPDLGGASASAEVRDAVIACL
ncbi:MAG: tartrate dehydrogenase, partial [Bryobacterales bacterium]|nr:tartrate dehydrogenase [Bryobacterales bacterium]